MWIENVSLNDIKTAYHYDPGPNSLLIQIVDPGVDWPTPKYPFKKVSQYTFLDEEDVDGPLGEFCITDDDAKRIVADLQYALDNYMNVVVHCHAGLCRSGAVAEVGIILGFTDTAKYRSPNILVKTKLLQAAGKIL